MSVAEALPAQLRVSMVVARKSEVQPDRNDPCSPVAALDFALPRHTWARRRGLEAREPRSTLQNYLNALLGRQD